MQHKLLKKLIAAGTAALLGVSLAACGGSQSQATSEASSASVAEAADAESKADAAAESKADSAAESKAEVSAESKAEAATETKSETTESPAATKESETEGKKEYAASKESAAKEKKEPAAEAAELIVFAAASMTETLEEIQKMYAEIAPDVTLTYNFDSSGTLVTQIEEGADCDLFISAAQKQMNEIDGTKGTDVNPDGLDLIDSDSRVDILENKVVLVVPEDNPKNINSFDDLAEALSNESILMAMGNEDVPVGQYTQKVLDYYGLDEAALATAGCITYGSNVKEVTTQVAEGSVDCGIIYCTDAYSAGLDIVDEATPEMCGQVIYPAAVLKASANAEATQNFLDYLQTDDAMAIFEKVGFSPVA